MSMPERNSEVVEDVDGNHESASSRCFEEEAERNMNVSLSDDAVVLNDNSEIMNKENDEELSNENALPKRKLDNFSDSDSGTKIPKIEIEKDKASCSQNEYEESLECAAMARFPDMEAFQNELDKFVDEDNQINTTMDTTASDQTEISNEDRPEASDMQRVMSKADVAIFFRKKAQAIISSLAKPPFQEVIQGMPISKGKEDEDENHAKSQASGKAISREGMQGLSGSHIESTFARISAEFSNLPSTSSAGEGETPLSIFPSLEQFMNSLPEHKKNEITGIVQQQVQDVKQEILEVNNLMNEFKRASNQFTRRLLGLTCMYEQAASKFDELN